MAITRRDFLRYGTISLGSVAAVPSVLLRMGSAQTSNSSVEDGPVIIAIFQRGAADGISMVVPFGDKHYYSLRPQIGIPEPARGGEERAIDLDGFFALHPSLTSLKPIYDEGHLAVVHAVGLPDGTRSHFDAQDYLEAGTPGMKSVADGWLNRYLQQNPQVPSSPFQAVALSSTVPRSLMGSTPTVAIQNVADFGLHEGRVATELEQAFAQMYSSTFEAVKMLRRANPEQYKPASGIQYPNSPLGRALSQISQLVKANLGVRVAFADVGGWDTHANQGSSRGQLANQLQNFGDSIAALYRDLGDRMRNIVVVTMTEFGRAIRQNGSGGTDHGHASCVFVAGGPVKGGKVYGRWPGLAPEQLFEGRDLTLTTDIRDVFAEILVAHMHANDVGKVFPGFKPNRPVGII